MNRSKRCFQSGHSLRRRVGWNSTFLLLYSSRHVTTKKVSCVHAWTNNSIGLANRIELNDYLDELFLKKKISYRRESFIHLNQGLFYENLLWSSLWAGKVIASKFKIFVMKMSECARLSVAAMVCVNLVALSSKNWSQIKHLSLLKFTGITDISYHLCKDNQLLSLERYQGSPCFQVRRLIYHNGDRQPMAKQLPE